MIAEGVEFLVDAILAVDNEGLVIRDIVVLAEVFENRWNLGFVAVGKWLTSNVLVMVELAGEQVKRPLAVARVDAGR